MNAGGRVIDNVAVALLGSSEGREGEYEWNPGTHVGCFCSFGIDPEVQLVRKLLRCDVKQCTKYYSVMYRELKLISR